MNQETARADGPGGARPSPRIGRRRGRPSYASTFSSFCRQRIRAGFGVFGNDRENEV